MAGALMYASVITLTVAAMGWVVGQLVMAWMFAAVASAARQ